MEMETFDIIAWVYFNILLMFITFYNDIFYKKNIKEENKVTITEEQYDEKLDELQEKIHELGELQNEIFVDEELFKNVDSIRGIIIGNGKCGKSELFKDLYNKKFKHMYDRFIIISPKQNEFDYIENKIIIDSNEELRLRTYVNSDEKTMIIMGAVLPNQNIINSTYINRIFKTNLTRYPSIFIITQFPIHTSNINILKYCNSIFIFPYHNKYHMKDILKKFDLPTNIKYDTIDVEPFESLIFIKGKEDLETFKYKVDLT